LFSEFGVTIMAAVFVSGAVSLTLTPMMCSRMLRPSREEHHGRLFMLTERGFDALLRAYKRSLAWVVRHKKSTLAFSAAVLAGTVMLFGAVPKGFLPSEDYGFLTGFSEAVEGISFESMIEHQREAAKVLLADPNIEGFVSSVGAGGPSATGNLGRFNIKLKPREERALSADEVVASLRPKLSRIPGLRVYLQNPPPVRLTGTMTKSLYQFTLQGADAEDLYRAGLALEQRLRDVPELVDVNSDLLLKNPQVEVDIEREQAARLGVSVEAIEDALYSAYGSRQVSTIYTATNQYWVIMELLREHQQDTNALAKLYVRSAKGELVPLLSVVTLRDEVGPLTINHQGQLPAVTISFNLAPGASIGPATEAIERISRELLPQTITTSFAGTAQAFQASEQGLGWLLLAAVLVIYLVLGILYESFVHPITILTGLPFAGFGALLTLWLFGVELSVYGFVGLIMLIGVVKKNAIMMIDFALDAQRAGALPEPAILEAAAVRFRPIMMTTLAALMATLPIALGIGAGSASRRPLGLVVVGGLLFSQLVTLYVTPVFYCYLDAIERRVLGWFRKDAGAVTDLKPSV
jgi:HAE1 family hydrophobic/amphiphilic exporter-1